VFYILYITKFVKLVLKFISCKILVFYTLYIIIVNMGKITNSD
jgi:hypothetical protein